MGTNGHPRARLHRLRRSTAPAHRDPGAEVLTIREVAAYLQLPLSTVYRLAERRELPGHKVGRRWRFHRTVLEEWFRSRAPAPHVTILVVDDDSAVREFLVAVLEGPRQHVRTAAGSHEALHIARTTAVDLVLLDLVMPGVDGVETFRQLRALHPSLPVVVVTGYPDAALMAAALAVGPFAVITKPLDAGQVCRIVDTVIGADVAPARPAVPRRPPAG